MHFDSEKAGMTDNAQLRFTAGILLNPPESLPASVRRLTLCSDSGTNFTSFCSTFGNRLQSLRSSGSPEIYAGMAAGRDHWRTFSSPGKRQPLPALLVASLNLPVMLRALLLLVLVTTEDVTEYLFWAKGQEVDKWLQDDIAIAIRTCVLAGEGVEHPDVCATYEILGLHPNQVWSAIIDRRKSLLGDLFDAWYGADGKGLADSDRSHGQLPPRKTSQSEILPQKAKGNAA